MIIHNPVITGSLQVNGTSVSSIAEVDNISGSVVTLTDASASLAAGKLNNTTDTLTGDLTVTGRITAQEFHTEFVSASIVYQSGSTKFGDSADDTHIFTGNVGIGTTQPSASIHIRSALPYIFLDDTSTSGTKPRFQIINGDIGSTQSAIFSFDNTSGSSTSNVLILNEDGFTGLGVTPYVNTLTNSSGIDFKGYGGIFGYNNSTYILANAHYDTAWTYKNTDSAGVFQVDGDLLTYRNAPSGTGGTAITLTERLRIDSTGKATFTGTDQTIRVYNGSAFTGIIDFGQADFLLGFDSSVFKHRIWDGADYFNALTYNGSGHSISLAPLEGKVGIGTSTFGTNSGKLYVGGYLIDGSSAIAQFDGFIRLEQQILIHDPVDNNAELQMLYSSANGLSFFGNNGSGNIGIGLTTPGTELEVRGLIRSSNSSSNYSTLGSNTLGGYVNGYTSSNQTFLIRSYAVDNIQGYFTAGNIGIGITSPRSLLDIDQNTPSSYSSGFNPGGLRVANDNSSGASNQTSNIVLSATGWAGQSTGVAHLGVIQEGGNVSNGTFTIKVRENGTHFEAFRIKYNGSVGIGTDSPQSKLHIADNVNTTKYVDSNTTLLLDHVDSRLQLCATEDGSNAAAILLSNEDSHWAIHHKPTSTGDYLGFGHTITTSTTDIVDTAMDAEQIKFHTAGHIELQEDHFINLRFSTGNIDNQNPAYILLCAFAGGNDVNGTITMDRTSGLRFACRADILVSAGGSATPVGGMRVFGTTGSGNPNFRLVRFDYAGTNYVGLEIYNTDAYYDTSGAYFTGRIKSTGEALIALRSTDISNVVDFEANTKHVISGEVDMTGIVRKPNNPAWWGYVPTLNSVVTDGSYNFEITGLTELFDKGNNFNPTTGTFTAPVSGVYSIHLNIEYDGGVANGDWLGATITLNGSQYTHDYNAPGASRLDWSNYNPFSQNKAFLVNLSANDYIRMSVDSWNGTGRTYRAAWGGFLVG